MERGKGLSVNDRPWGAARFRLIGGHFRHDRAIFAAASHAQRAADFINSLQPGSGG